LIRTLVNADMPAGKKSVNWDGKDQSNQEVSAGIYFLRLEGEDKIATQQIVLLR
jgi:flagellar hook assembly protein FlgD